jgi:rhodanese-related sulfurtransferase
MVVVVVMLMLHGCSQSTKPQSAKPQFAERSVAVESRSNSASVGSTRTSSDRPVRSSDRPVRLVSDVDELSETSAYPSVTLEELNNHVENRSAVIVDARSPQRFAQGHVREAINVPTSDEEAYTEQNLGNVDRGQFIIIYCGGASCHASEALYQYLVTQGFTNMRVFQPGWEALAPLRQLQ